MRFSALRRAFSTSLRTRMLLLTLLAFVLVAAPAFFSFSFIVNTTIVRLGTLFAEKQVLFDRFRGMGALLQELTLAETLSRAGAIREWAQDENDPEKRARGLAELEHYREAFTDKSYFFVVYASGNYYFNDAANSYAGKQLSHRLSRDNPRDGWFYSTVALGEGCHLNVDHDDVLAVTNVWINCVIRDGGEVIGVLGTGLNLTAFVREVVDFPQAGVETMFVDPSGAVQAHRNESLIDFHSLTKDAANRRTVFSLLDRPQDRAAMQAMMDAVTTGEVEVRSAPMRISGHDMLVGVGYLPRLGWYNVTLMDLDRIIDRGLFLPIGILLGVTMLAAASLVALVFKRTVLDRLAEVETRVAALKAGDFEPAPADPRPDEIGRLSRAFASMASTVGDNTQALESLVRARTEELESLAFRDQMTGIANRRGFSDAFAAVQAEADANGARLALLLLDVDHFKRINDTRGHTAGDLVVAELARRLAAIIRPGDICGRWGGDEFIVLINDLGPHSLRSILDLVQRAVSAEPFPVGETPDVAVTVSIGAYLVEPGDTLEAAADLADTALYRAKADGRNRVMVYDSVTGGTERMSA